MAKNGGIREVERDVECDHAPRHILLTGRPGVGKTTVLRRLLERQHLASAAEGGRPAVFGFLTGEIRRGSDRVGFHAESLTGERCILAHRSRRGGPRVGRYGVDVAAFEELVLPVLEELARHGRLGILDEIGKMECLSSRFRDLVTHIFNQGPPVIATIPIRGLPFAEGLRQRRDVRIVEVTIADRDSLVGEVLEPFSLKLVR